MRKIGEPRPLFRSFPATFYRKTVPWLQCDWKGIFLFGRTNDKNKLCGDVIRGKVFEITAIRIASRL